MSLVRTVTREEPTIGLTALDVHDRAATREEQLANESQYADYGSRQVKIIDWKDTGSLANNPYSWTSRRKWVVGSTALTASFIIPINGTSITVAASQINAQFGISDASWTNSYWPVTSWCIGGAVAIITLFPLIEDLGVRRGFLLTYTVFFLTLIPQAFTPTFAGLITSRFFSGGAVTVLANISSSVVSDLWETDRGRSIPVSLYVVLYLMGNTAGPTIFAPVMQFLDDWRWIFYIQLIVYGTFFPIFAYLLEETRADVILRQHAIAQRKQGIEIYAQAELDETPLLSRLMQAAKRPAYLLFTEPVLAASTLLSSFSTGTVFLLTQSLGQVTTTLFGWEEYSSGYLLGAVTVGEAVGFLFNVLGIQLYFRSARSNKETPGLPIPEARLWISVPAAFGGLVGGMLMYGWTSSDNVPWIALAIGLGLVGCGIQVIVTTLADYVIDAYSPSSYAGSAIAAVAAGENIVAGILPFAATRLYTNLGFHWASSLLALVAFVLSLSLVVIIWHGRRFREKSPFMLAGPAGKFYKLS